MTERFSTILYRSYEGGQIIMMRSLYSGVAGLKTHQTRMDVIGNNISNVNTVGFKSSSANFADTFYQTVSPATGPDGTSGTAGTNAKQIGLGSQVAAITTNITQQGGTSSTNRALDVAIQGDSFLVVKSAGATYFTKSGALNVDESGTLYCTTNGATVQGWMADDEGNITKDLVKDLTVMSADHLYYEPEETNHVRITGNIDKADKQLTVTNTATPVTDHGLPLTFSFYDELGQQYTVKMYAYATGAGTTGTGTDARPTTTYAVTLADVYDSEGNSIFVKKTTAAGVTTYTSTGTSISLGGATYSIDTTVTGTGINNGVTTSTGAFKLAANGNPVSLAFVAETGEFSAVTEDGGIANTSEDKGNVVAFGITPGTGADAITNTFSQYTAGTDKGGIKIDFSQLTQYSSGGVSSTSYTRGNAQGNYAGNQSGQMSGISIDEKGFIYGTYSNGFKKCLAQMSVATFANPSGLEAVGNSMFAASLNSGLFNGVGEEISLSGKFTVGALEMSNVDLASEFTTMIITQRGFQANSRIITTSDSMLEELVNLKR